MLFQECVARGANVLLGPTLNIHRTFMASFKGSLQAPSRVPLRVPVRGVLRAPLRVPLRGFFKGSSLVLECRAEELGLGKRYTWTWRLQYPCQQAFSRIKVPSALIHGTLGL